MIVESLLPKAPAYKKALRNLMRRKGIDFGPAFTEALQNLYQSTPPGPERRAIRSLLMQSLLAEPAPEPEFKPKKLPTPPPPPEPEPEPEPEPIPEPPKPKKPAKKTQMMSLDLSDAAMMLQFGGGSDAEDDPIDVPEPEDAASVDEADADQSNDDFWGSDEDQPEGSNASDFAEDPTNVFGSDFDPFADSDDDMPVDTASDPETGQNDPLDQEVAAGVAAELAKDPEPEDTGDLDFVAKTLSPSQEEPEAPEPTVEAEQETIAELPPVAEQITPPTVDEEAAKEAPKPKKKKSKATDLSSLSGNSALFDQLGDGFGDIGD